MYEQKTLTHWGWVTHIWVSNLTSIGSDKVLSPDQHPAIIWTSPGIFLIGPLGTNVIEILIEIHTFSFKKMHLKMSSAKLRQVSFGLNVLIVMYMWQGLCWKVIQTKFEVLNTSYYISERQWNVVMAWIMTTVCMKQKVHHAALSFLEVFKGVTLNALNPPARSRQSSYLPSAG